MFAALTLALRENDLGGDVCTERTSPATARRRSSWWLPRSRMLPPPPARSRNHGRAAVGPIETPSSAASCCPASTCLQRLERLGRVPLVPDRADATGSLAGGDDRVRVLQRAGDRLLEVDGNAALERRDRRRRVMPRRRRDPERVDLLGVEQRAPVLVDSRLAARELLRPRAVDVADRDELVTEVLQDGAVVGGDPAGTDDRDPEHVVGHGLTLRGRSARALQAHRVSRETISPKAASARSRSSAVVSSCTGCAMSTMR